ncbi:Uncharacterised protein [Corynebacterium renale]|nr:Uncharacterised protein [Corynebacterium renale]STD01217.1 Uncharacterised protein [Corynebacterium renale]
MNLAHSFLICLQRSDVTQLAARKNHLNSKLPMHIASYSTIAVVLL